MSDQNSDDGDSVRAESIRLAFEATHEALVSLDVKRLEELLESYSEQGHSIDDAERRWQNQKLQSLNAKYAYLWTVRLPWWSTFRAPVWTSVFLVLRQWGRNRYGSDPEKLAWLDELLGRAEFSVRLSSVWRNYLRQKIDSGSISRWVALSTARSFGCKVSREGEISPNPIGPAGYLFGITVVVLLVLVIVLFASVVINELFRPCMRGCVFIGSIQIVVWASYIAAVAHSLSQGRRNSVKVLQSLLSEF